MKKVSKIIRAIKEPKRIILYLNSKGVLDVLSDKAYVSLVYGVYFKKRLNLKNPKTYNEKLQWLKLYDRNPLYTRMVDKCEVKKYVADKIGEEYIIPTLGVYDRFEDIDFDSLPNEFVIKCTHDSGGLVICKDKSQLDIKNAKKIIESSLKRNYYMNGREWPYKDVKPRIIIEKYMVDESGYELKDYKFFCFNGEAKLLFVAKDRGSSEETKFDFFDRDFNHLPFTNGHPNSDPPYFKPDNFEKMMELASELSKDSPQLRVDFYNINGQIYFGELTFFHWGGMMPFDPPEWDIKLGEMITLPIKKKSTKHKGIVSYLNSKGVFNILPDKAYLSLMYRFRLGKRLRLKNPTTFNEKMQWLKLYNRKPIYTLMVDKYEVKKYVADLIGEEYVIPTLGIWDRFDDIDFDSLPDQFVLKTTHDSGGVIVCKNKSELDMSAARAKLEQSLGRNYYCHGREWPYKDVKPRIMAEKYMQDRNFEVLNVYKIFNFNGVPKLIQSIQGDKTAAETIDYFDTEWNLLDLKQNYPNSENPLPKPDTLDEMLELARKLSSGVAPFIRTDFYEVNGRVYFSEFTFFSDSGTAKFSPPEWDERLGSWIELPAKKG